MSEGTGAAASPRRRRRATPAPRAEGQRLIPPRNGVTVRMYRIGHGDCFLLAFDGEKENEPVYVLVDCGYKPGSPRHINTSVAEIVQNLREATGGHLHVAVITHEHQDHVNGISATRFQGFTIGETWLAWTENPGDNLANDLRVKFKDKLLGLLAARNRLAAAGDANMVRRLDQFLEFEFGGDEDESFAAPANLGMLGAAKDPLDSMNKRSMKVFKDLAQNGPRYILPHKEILSIPGAKDLRVFALGPPQDIDSLLDLNPQGHEEFHGMGLAAASPGNYFAAAATAADAERHCEAPFANRYCILQGQALADPEYGAFFTAFYGDENTPSSHVTPKGNSEREADEVHDNPPWRRIDKEWLLSAEQLALDMNNQTNNASLVLAFELGKGGKVLLFAADAQRGNWISWARKSWKEGEGEVTTRDLLSRTVLYKVGHHGSHNATLNGTAESDHANLAWMATGEHGREFTAMITAVRSWAETQDGWDHPLKAIKDALLRKASGRVFQTDTALDQMEMPDTASEADWKRFLSRARGDRLFFDYEITR